MDRSGSSYLVHLFLGGYDWLGHKIRGRSESAIACQVLEFYFFEHFFYWGRVGGSGEVRGGERKSYFKF